MEDYQIIALFGERSEKVEEYVNDTYLCAWNSIPPNKPERLAVYLGKITRNLSLNRVKYYSAKRRGLGQTELVLSELEGCISAANNVEQELDERFLIKAIEDFLYEQSVEKRNIFIRRYWYMTPIKEIANAYGMSESKTTSLLFRMRKELKVYLEKEGISL